MNLEETRRYEMLVRVRDYGAEHGDAFPASSLGGQMFGDVGKAVTQLAQEMASEVSGHSANREAHALSRSGARASGEPMDPSRERTCPRPRCARPMAANPSPFDKRAVVRRWSVGPIRLGPEAAQNAASG